ncbi:hypothetical protein [Pedobacter flavus]|uniref:Carboxypeptidase-like regulatory domain-containing protein n=1 Tax=Pedobacter flavus TaxID=3113906 RepID=A0ABU7GYI7_9SPHI|nr:hypothetical protein [Pedobacter sp. VNH31]MEE1884082.1 hypothetical protein [Pedobacter sp. VNH31]
MKKLLFLALMILISTISIDAVFAQEVVNGNVYDYQKRTTPLEKVSVKNLTNKSSTFTNNFGAFQIPAKLGDLLEFSTFGYHTDTIYLIDLKPKRIYLPTRENLIETVNFEQTKLSPYLQLKDPDAKEFKQLMTDDARGKKNDDRAGGLIFTLGYGKFRKERLKLEALAEKEKIEGEIDEKFNAEKIGKLLELKGQELTDFMELYRPTVAEVKEQQPFNYDYYIIQSYHKWLKTPPSQRKLPALPKIPIKP